MPTRQAKVGAAIAIVLVATVLGAACGARSELDAPKGRAPKSVEDAGTDAPIDAPVDVPEDVPEDVPFPNECEDPESVTYVYVVTSENELHAFKPQNNTFQLRGTLNCPAGGASPFSMAVSRTGIAHVVYNDGQLFRVSVLDASCEPTTFMPGQFGFNLFGMGFGADQDDGGGETLYVAEISFNQPSLGLGSLDLDTLDLAFIGAFSQNPGNAIELTPTGSGPLWGYFLNEPGPGGTLVEIDTATAQIVSSIPVNVGMNSSALAVAWWGGAFYIFTTPGSGGSEVNRFDPVSMTSTLVATFPLTIVGAGVSTCAPASLP